MILNLLQNSFQTGLHYITLLCESECIGNRQRGYQLWFKWRDAKVLDRVCVSSLTEFMAGRQDGMEVYGTRRLMIGNLHGPISHIPQMIRKLFLRKGVKGPQYLFGDVYCCYNGRYISPVGRCCGFGDSYLRYGFWALPRNLPAVCDRKMHNWWLRGILIHQNHQ